MENDIVLSESDIISESFYKMLPGSSMQLGFIIHSSVSSAVLSSLVPVTRINTSLDRDRFKQSNTTYLDMPVSSVGRAPDPLKSTLWRSQIPGMDQASPSNQSEDHANPPGCLMNDEETAQNEVMDTTPSTLPNELDTKCFICGLHTDDDRKLRPVETTGPSLKNAAANRSKLTSDKFENATKQIEDDGVEGRVYHPTCYRQYVAVKKRPRSEQEEETTAKRQRVETRRTSSLPETEHRGILKSKCIFCGKERKKKKGKDDPLINVSTKDGCRTLFERAPRSKNEYFKNFIMSMMSEADLIAKEGKYHKSCRIDFMHETDIKQSNSGSSRDVHKKAYGSLYSTIQQQVVQNKRSLLISSLLNRYREEYCSNGGDFKDVASYTPQNLSRKIQGSFGDKICITLADARRGNYIYNASLSQEQGKAQLYDDAREYEENEKLTWAALHLWSQIMQLPKSKTSNPATVQNLKECSPDIPKQVDQFFRTLLTGIPPTFQGSQKGAMDRKVSSMASDAIFNVSRGTIKLWKHTVMGLGLASLTGSKIALQVLNRAGHSLSYSETKELETEFAYSVSSDGLDAPDGIRLLPDRATGFVWDNNDANVETLDGKSTLHSTVGHTYQNIADEDRDQQCSQIQYREEKNRRTFVGSDQDIQPYRMSLKMAQFTKITTG
ncbi:uncharacterized protein [Palaemon carinicauda]|uniref:uncharacterized protein n=1 Tax=Palaemon carinicauda TaxID=392227 RepID=UPI0035B5DCA7